MVRITVKGTLNGILKITINGQARNTVKGAIKGMVRIAVKVATLQLRVQGDSSMQQTKNDKRGEYFCSYGLPPLHAAFTNKHCSECTHNTKILQSPLSNVCGQYIRELLSIYSTPI